MKNDNLDHPERLNEISTYWNNASDKDGIFDKDLGRTLGEKSRYWSDRELFKQLGKDKEIIKITEVVDEIDKLYLKL